MRFWAYRHISGDIHVKNASKHYIDEDLEEAYASDFVEDVLDVYEAKDYKQAARIARKHLRVPYGR